MIQQSQHKNINSKYWQNRTQNPIVKGYFPRYKSYREMSIAKVNRLLCILLVISIIVSFISYYFVTTREVTLNKIGNEITEIKAQNLELQNKLDNLESYYNVDKMVKQKNLLQKPQQIIQINSSKDIHNISNEKTNKNMQQKNENTHWTTGF